MFLIKTASSPNFRQLRELELLVSWPNSPNRTPPSSITSIELRGVIVSVQDTYNLGAVAQTEVWASIDKELCGVVNLLSAVGYRHTLEAELRLRRIKGNYGKYDFTKFLPKFREKRVVTISCRNRLFCSSVRSRSQRFDYALSRQ